MGQNPINLAVRFLLELLALVAMGYWGWNYDTGPIRYVLAIGVPLLAAAFWGTFRIPEESPHGRAPVPVPGRVRLLLEAAFFTFAAWGLFDSGAVRSGWWFASIVAVHYGVSYDRVRELLRR